MNPIVKAKHDALLAWLARWSHLPPQGSPEWQDSRGGTVGGSELQTLLTSEHEFVGRKIGISQIPSVLPMTWGSVFETVSRAVSELLFGAKVYESGSVPSAEHPLKTYSLDGIGLVRLRAVARSPSGAAPAWMWLYVLFEYKNLWSRAPVHGRVYPEYIPQVKSGMADLGIPEMAVYIEQVVRICTIRQLRRRDSSHNTAIHRESPPGQLPVGYGYMLVCRDGPVDEVPNSTVQDLVMNPGQDIGGVEHQGRLHDVLLAIKSGFLTAEIGPVSIDRDVLLDRSEFMRAQDLPFCSPSQADVLTAMRAHASSRGSAVLCVIPFKIMDLNIVPVQKEPGYTASHSGAIDSAMSKVQELQKIEDRDEMYTAYTNMYPCLRRKQRDLDDMDSYTV